MKKIHKVRLKQLADHIRTVPDAEWDFAVMSRPCGCALAHATDIFPRLVKADERQHIVDYKGNRNFNAIAHDLFGVTDAEAERLFTYARPWHPEAVLPETATQGMVADNIEKFLEER